MLKNNTHRRRVPIYDEIIRNGILLSALGAFMVIAVVIFFLLQDNSSLKCCNKALEIGCISLVSSLILLPLGRKDQLKIRIWLVSSILISIGFVCASYVVMIDWGRLDSAEKILTLGFALTLMTWHINVRAMLIAITPISLMYLNLCLITSDANLIEFTLTVTRFPILFVAFMLTVRRFYYMSEKQRRERDVALCELERLSAIDILTSVANRKGFDQGLKSAINCSRESSRPLTLVTADIDFFKQYNDSLGHPAGDWCLKKVAEIIKGQCERSTDIVARIGGEEFAIILPDTNADQARELVKKITMAIEKAGISHPDSAVSKKITLSWGIREYKSGGALGLYTDADKALYKAKSFGRNQFVVYEND